MPKLRDGVLRVTLRRRMTPEKLFNYLDGNLPSDEREELDRQLASDPNLQRELAVARAIHAGMARSREAAASSGADEERAGRFGRKVATAFAALVLLNVLIGIVFIVGHGRTGKTAAPAQDAAIRHQLSSSLEQKVEAALPPPTLGDEIVMVALPSERESIAEKVVAAAAQCGGSGAKALPNEKTATVIVELPGKRERDFRQALALIGEVTAGPVPETASSSEKKLLQVQILDRTAPQKQ